MSRWEPHGESPTPTNAPGPRSRKKVLLLTAIIVSWCLIAASVVVILVVDPPDFDLQAGSDSGTPARLAEQVDALATALADGDRESWLAMFGGQAAGTAARYFDNLRALGAESLDLREAGQVTPADEVARGAYASRIALSFCLRPPDPDSCDRTEVDYDVIWSREEGGLRVVDIAYPPTAYYRPQAWEAADLSIATGERATVVASADAGIDPAGYLAAVEAAVEHVEHVEQFELLDPVDSYLVVLATDEQFQTWYGHNVNDYSKGFAVPTYTEAGSTDSAGPYQVLMPVERHDATSFDPRLRHELTHAATLQGSNMLAGRNEDTWWMMEGIAEYVAAGDTMPSSLVEFTRAQVTAGHCDNGIDQWDATQPVEDYHGRLGCAYLAVRHMVNEYGLEQFMALFRDIYVDDGDPEDLAPEHFGIEYTELMAEISDYIARSV